jgi:hypothetical protein
MSSAYPTQYQIQEIFNKIYDATDHTLCFATKNTHPNTPAQYELQFILNDCWDETTKTLNTK